MLALVLFAGLLAVPSSSQQITLPGVPAEQQWDSVDATPAAPAKMRHVDLGKPWVAPTVGWPAAGSATVDLSSLRGSAFMRAGTLPVRFAADGAGALSRLNVTLADRRAAARAGVNGLLLSVRSLDAAGRVRVSVNYATIAGAFGGDWANRLRIVTLPSCALDTPEVASCQIQTPVTTSREPGTDEVTARIDVAAAASVRQTATVFALASGGSGDSGDYTATPLKPSGTWNFGGNSGDFTYSYPIAVCTRQHRHDAQVVPEPVPSRCPR